MGMVTQNTVKMIMPGQTYYQNEMALFSHLVWRVGKNDFVVFKMYQQSCLML